MDIRYSVNLVDSSAVVKYLYTMTQADAVRGIRNAARRRDRADKSRREARAELKRYCKEALNAGVPISQIAREAKLSRQSVYALLGQSPFQ
jgi:DNA invertase Pin-like site-specific DNA recombinase